MPTYVYQVVHEDGTEGEIFEIVQRMSDPAITEHPETGEPVQRVFVAPNLTLKHSTGREKKILENDNLAKKGFTKYERDKATNTYHRVAGKEGPETFQR